MTKEERKAYNKHWRETHREYINAYMRKHGHRLRGFQRSNFRWTKDLLDKFAKMYIDKKKYHISDIALEFGITKKSAYSVARRLNLKRQ